jgi:predicted membrane-bound mannosyltransferase
MYAYIGERKDAKMLNSDYPCRVWLLGVLSETEPTDSEDIKRWATESGYSKSELRAAKQELKVISKNNGTRNQVADKWFWFLPEGD